MRFLFTIITGMSLSMVTHAAQIEYGGTVPDTTRAQDATVTTTTVACEVQNRVGQFQCQQICRNGGTPSCKIVFPYNALPSVAPVSPATTATGRTQAPLKTDAAMAAQMQTGAAAMRKH